MTDTEAPDHTGPDLEPWEIQTIREADVLTRADMIRISMALNVTITALVQKGVKLAEKGIKLAEAGDHAASTEVLNLIPDMAALLKKVERLNARHSTMFRLPF